MPIDPLTGQPFMPETPSPPPHTNTEARTRRVDEFEKRRLDDPDPYKACLGAIQADLMRINFRLADAVKRQLDGPDLSVDMINDAERSLTAHLRYTRQTERLRQLELREDEQERSSNPPSLAEHASTSGPDDTDTGRTRTPK